ncbi:hypothetical protein CCACVL1_02957 [Corchorus capsularis]|uniref:Uncharacterized protein n=1 Tax=Corchorus capsularis TaxID=210143 RepID=A0A1R3K4G5_COCAP|nr:hypothetical protein CCACVL1_02960 [Corchorus capsularis]OMP01972.1 hypothetical protein CCACVL1_02957 [Corchorus capsularis]
MAYPNNCFAKDGFLATECINELNTFPIPTAAPAKAIVAAPAPIDLAPSSIFKTLLLLSFPLQKAAPQEFSLILCVCRSSNSHMELFHMFEYLEMLFQFWG